MPAQSRARLVLLAAMRAEERLLRGVSDHVGRQVALAATGIRTDGAFERLEALVDPQVLLKIRAASTECLCAVWTLVHLAAWENVVT